jgi:outer membrane lipoprotein-sorting protein
MLRAFGKVVIFGVLLIAISACAGSSTVPSGEDLGAQAQQAWSGSWHAVWQVEWEGAPVRGPLVAEVWHAPGGRLRVETLEAPTPALNGLTFVTDGATAWLHDLGQDQTQIGSEELTRIPLVSDALYAIDWLFLSLEGATIVVAGRDELESGQATKLDIITEDGDWVELWVHEKTGFPARVEMKSTEWGKASFVTRSITALEQLHPDLFRLSPADARDQP